MTELSGPPLVARIEADIEHLPFPAFIIDVRPDGFTYRCSNAAHKTIFGYDGDTIAGARPIDLVPRRLSDSLTRNYEQCRDSGQAYYYDEVTTLKSGPRWWRKGLTPIHDRHGQVIAIVGEAIDITEEKSSIFSLTHQVARLSTQHEDLCLDLSTHASELSATMDRALTLLDMTLDGFIDLGDDKIQLLRHCEQTLRKGMTGTRALRAFAQTHAGKTPRLSELDFAHICADLTALLDPTERFRISFCEATVITDRVLLHLATRALVKNAMAHAVGWISIDIDACNGGLRLTVTDDGSCETEGRRPNSELIIPDGLSTHPLDELQLLLRDHGGGLSSTVDSAQHRLTIEATLPGKLADPHPLDMALSAG